MPISTQNRKALSQSVKKQVQRKSLWDGPTSNTPNGGLTQSAISKFLCCRERFRLAMVEGLLAQEEFDYKSEYGNIWHLAEEQFAKGEDWKKPILDYCARLFKKYPMAGKSIDQAYNCCLVQFPIYIDWWQHHDDVRKRKPIYQEQVFNVPYELPNGVVVWLKGKWDSVDLIDKLVFIAENKSRSDIDVELLKSHLPSDLQSNIYMVALVEHIKQLQEEDATWSRIWGKQKLLGKPIPLGGVRYNVVRRPLSGMKYCIKQKKGLGKSRKGAETKEMFYDRLGKLIKENAKDFFCRVKMEVSTQEIEDFKAKCLTPILYQIWQWWESIKDHPFDPWHITKWEFDQDEMKNLPEKIPNPYHHFFPHGVYNSTLEGRGTALDSYLATGSTVGLQRRTELFSELK